MKVIAKRDGNWEELTNKNDIENTIHESNHIKFSQTNSTPAMSSPLVQDLGFLGDTLACE